jgi:ABC-type nitrate/sulfonate/bicarbonate transport system substrate-binding protein
MPFGIENIHSRTDGPGFLWYGVNEIIKPRRHKKMFNQDRSFPLGSLRGWLSLGLPPKPSHHPRIRISAAHHEWNHVVIPLVAMAKGFFAEDELNEVELVTMGNEAWQIEGLAEGSIDFGVDPQTRLVLAAAERGTGITIIGARRRGHGFIMIGQPELKSMQDLKGKRIVLGAKEMATDIQARQLLKDSGLNPDRDLKFIYTGSIHDCTEGRKIFLSRGAEATMIGWQDVDGYVRDGYSVLADMRKLYPPRQDRITVASGRMVREHPDTVKAFLKGIMRASAFCLEKNNQEEIRSIILEAGFPWELIKDLFYRHLNGFKERLAADLTLPIEGVEQAIKEEQASGNLTTSFVLDRAIDLQPLKEAQREMRII